MLAQSVMTVVFVLIEKIKSGTPSVTASDDLRLGYGLTYKVPQRRIEGNFEMKRW